VFSVRCAVTGLAVTFLGVMAVPAAAAAGVNTDRGTNALPAGHCLKTLKNVALVQLESRSQRFQLDMFDDGQLSLENQVELRGVGEGYTTWDAYLPPKGKEGHRASLCMSRGGDLVLRKDSHIVWRSGTAGKAPGGQARLTDSGRLVVRTVNRRIVWSSRTTAVLLIRGDRVPSGSTLVNRTFPGSTTRLQMSKDGDLVLQRNRDTVWRTDTHARGSALVITATGRMAIRSPHGKTLWRSPAEGSGAILRVAQSGRLVLDNSKDDIHCWVRPAHSDPDCGTG
jgi:hypothetical protein